MNVVHTNVWLWDKKWLLWAGFEAATYGDIFPTVSTNWAIKRSTALYNYGICGALIHRSHVTIIYISLVRLMQQSIYSCTHSWWEWSAEEWLGVPLPPRAPACRVHPAWQRTRMDGWFHRVHQRREEDSDGSPTSLFPPGWREEGIEPQ